MTRSKPTERSWNGLMAALADTRPVDLSWITPPPTNHGWTLAPDALRLLSRLITSMLPRHVIEFGAGISTRMLARAGVATGRALAISSIDHDPEFGPPAAAAARDWIESATAPLRSPVRVRFQHAPLVVRDCGGKLLPVYHWDPRRLASRRPADLVLIDGPPINLGGREGVLYQAIEVARPGTLMLLDDANRPAEQAAVRHWQESLGDRIEARTIPGFAHGLVVVVVGAPLLRTDLWAERGRRSVAELLAIVPEGARVAVVDAHYWGTDWLPGRHCEPFIGYPPADDAAAVAALTAARGTTDFWVITWPSFWWLDYYKGFFQQLRQNGRVVAEHDRLLVVDLRRDRGT